MWKKGKKNTLKDPFVCICRHIIPIRITDYIRLTSLFIKGQFRSPKKLKRGENWEILQ